MDQLIISLNLSAAVLTLLYILHLIGSALSTRSIMDSGYAATYFHMKRSLLNQDVRRRA